MQKYKKNLRLEDFYSKIEYTNTSCTKGFYYKTNKAAPDLTNYMKYSENIKNSIAFDT